MAGKYFVENQLGLERAHISRHLARAIDSEISALDDHGGEGASADANEQRGTAIFEQGQRGERGA